MNRTEFHSMLEDIYKDIEAENGNFQDAFGSDAKTISDAKFIAAVSLMAVDRYYSNLTKALSERKPL